MIPGVDLICPACRGVQGNQLVVGHLEPHPAGLVCTRCKLVHPVVDGVPIVLRTPDDWLEQELELVMARRDLPEPVLDRLAAGGRGPLRRSLLRLRFYRGCMDGPLQDWVREVVAGLDGQVLDLCCGIGTHDRNDVVGVDLDWMLLGEYPGHKLLADSLDPPFVADSFDHILLLGAVDSVRNPWLLLRQADALVRPGGSIIVSVPFAWRDEVTQPSAQIDEKTLLSFFSDQSYTMELGEKDWVLNPEPRTTTVHRCLTIRAVKPQA